MVKVTNSNENDKKNYLGVYQFDVQYIYNNFPDHASHNCWIGLFNYENDTSDGLNGYLRLSISVLHEQDKKCPLELKDSDVNSKNLLVPSINTGKINFQMLCFYVYCVFDIPDMDRSTSNDYIAIVDRKNCKSDTFVEIEFMDKKIKTTTQKLVADYSRFCEVIKIPIIEPRLSNKVCIKLYDQDSFSSNDLIGTLEFNIDDLLKPGKLIEAESIGVEKKDDDIVLNLDPNAPPMEKKPKKFSKLDKDDIRLVDDKNYTNTSSEFFDFKQNLDERFNYIRDKEIFEDISVKVRYDVPSCYPIYGCNPNDSSKEIGVLMDKNSEIGNMYKGTIVMKIAKDSNAEKPKGECLPFIPEEKERNFLERKCPWNLNIQLYEVNLFYPIPNRDEFKVAFSVGERFIKFFVKFFLIIL